MQTIIDALRDVLGEPHFYHVLNGSNPTWDYSAMIEYMVGAIVLLIVVSSIFKIVLRIFK